MTRSCTPSEPVSREAQAEKIHAILCDHLKTNLLDKSCLEVGCGSGAISYHLIGKTRQIVGVEIDGKAIFSSPYLSNRASQFIQGDGRQLPFADDQFDIIILAQVYEHMTNQEKLSAEIYRVLKPGGVCFFSGPNRWQVIEPHYFLPFLAWLPHNLASAYLRCTGRGDSFDIYPRGYWGIKKLWRKFSIFDYTWQMIKKPEKLGMAIALSRVGLWRILPSWLLKLLKPFYGNYNWILVKENRHSSEK